MGAAPTSVPSVAGKADLEIAARRSKPSASALGRALTAISTGERSSLSSRRASAGAACWDGRAAREPSTSCNQVRVLQRFRLAGRDSILSRRTPGPCFPLRAPRRAAARGRILASGAPSEGRDPPRRSSVCTCAGAGRQVEGADTRLPPRALI